MSASIAASGAAAIALRAGHGQGLRQVSELVLAFGLSSLIGLERQLRGKSAGLRTQAIVGTASALIMLVSKYGFADVLSPGEVVLDPSRVAAQIVSGIGFLGAGLIITRHGATRGLTTAAAVWGTAAIGMAAGAGLPLLAIAATALHFIVVLVYTPLLRVLPGADTDARVQVVYEDGRGVLRAVLAECAARRWAVIGMSVASTADAQVPAAALAPVSGTVEVTMHLRGPDVTAAPAALGVIDGVATVLAYDDDSE